MSDFVIFPAANGYAVAVVTAGNFGPSAAQLIPIIAWKIDRTGWAEPVTNLTRVALMANRFDTPNREAQMLVYEDGIVIHQPDGTLLSEHGKRWDSLAAWLSYQKDWYDKWLRKKPAATLGGQPY